MWLGLASVLVFPALGFFGTVIGPLLGPLGRMFGFSLGLVVAMSGVVLSVAALVTSVRAYRAGERSPALWIGLVLAVLVALFWGFMVVGELVFPH